MPLFGSSGIRGIVNKEFVQLVFEVGLAVGSLYRSAVVGHDTRTSSDALRHALISGLLSAGCKACDAGMVPTPTLAYATKKFDCGVMITASHNPLEYNGIKLWNPDGSAFDAAQRQQIEEMVFDKASSFSRWEKIESCGSCPGLVEEHIDHVLANFPNRLGLKVVVDCGCGAASLVTPYLLRKMGCEVVTLNCYPDGYLLRGEEPGPENLEHLARVVNVLGADLAIAHDGDGDRMVVIDDKARFIPGDKLLALFALNLKAKKVITTVDASMVLEELGFVVTRTKVGDAFISEELKNGSDFGGEPCGTWFFPKISYCPDGIYAAANIAHIASENSLALLVDEIPSYPVLRGSLLANRAIMARVEKGLMNLDPLSVNRVDGIRLSFNGGWLLVRASGTEPKIRVTAEAKTRQRAEHLYQIGLRAINESVKEETAGLA